MSGRCALRLRECIHFARKRGILSRRSAAGSGRLLQGGGKFMRHVKLRPETLTNAAVLSKLIDTAYWDIKSRVENGLPRAIRFPKAIEFPPALGEANHDRE